MTKKEIEIITIIIYNPTPPSGQVQEYLDVLSTGVLGMDICT